MLRVRARTAVVLGHASKEVRAMSSAFNKGVPRGCDTRQASKMVCTSSVAEYAMGTSKYTDKITSALKASACMRVPFMHTDVVEATLALRSRLTQNDTITQNTP